MAFQSFPTILGNRAAEDRDPGLRHIDVCQPGQDGSDRALDICPGPFALDVGTLPVFRPQMSDDVRHRFRRWHVQGDEFRAAPGFLL